MAWMRCGFRKWMRGVAELVQKVGKFFVARIRRADARRYRGGECRSGRRESSSACFPNASGMRTPAATGAGTKKPRQERCRG